MVMWLSILECYRNIPIFNGTYTSQHLKLSTLLQRHPPGVTYTTQHLPRITQCNGTILRWQPSTHWKHETPLPGRDCIMWVTHNWQLLLLVIELFGTFSWLESNILKPPFWGKNLHFLGSASLMTYCSYFVYSNDIQELNMSSNTCHF